MLSTKFLVLIITIFLNCLLVLGTDCNVEKELVSSTCLENEKCALEYHSNIGTCICLDNFERDNETGACVGRASPVQPTSTESHPVVWTLMSLILIAFVIVAIYYSHKLRLVSWVRYKLNQRYNRNFDDVMIGQDD